jgi:hypothetical protein
VAVLALRTNSFCVPARHFKTLEIALVAGRDFTYRDDHASTPIAIVNETLARRFWQGRMPSVSTCTCVRWAAE